MEKVFNKPHDYTLNPLELKTFYEELKSIIWVIRIAECFDHKPMKTSFATGFSVDSNGFVLTCSHMFNKDSVIREVRMRRLDEDGFPYEADIVFHKPRWDLLLLQVKNVGNCCFGKFACNESVFAGETLLHIGHPANFVGSFLIGKAVYPCVNVVVPSGTRETCGEYISISSDRTSDFRVMGDAWNSDIFDTSSLKLFGFEKNLHPLIPIIQISGFVARGGSVGGPLFNTRGEIVGMIESLVDGYQIAIHVAMLKHFMEEFKKKIHGGNIKRAGTLDDKVGTSKRLKGKVGGYD